MATIVYLDVEDEITSAASRIRAAADSRVGLVIPFGSRVATSRINFRLLAREAMSHGRRLDIVAPDASARALAASAGLPVFASVGEYEEALDEDDAQAAARRAEARAAAGITGAAAITPSPRGGGSPRSGTPPDAAPSTGATAAGAGAAGSGAAAAGASTGTAAVGRRRLGRRGAHRRGGSRGRRRTSDPVPADRGARRRHRRRRRCRDPKGRPSSLPVAHGRSRRRPIGLAVGILAIVLIVGGAAAFAGYLLLPHAAITLTPHVETVGPVTFSVRADPSATSVDQDAAVVPAVTITIPVEAEGEFPATGKRVERTAATGAVRWTNCDPTAPYNIPSGTVVRTAAGIDFSTDEAVFLPVAILSGRRRVAQARVPDQRGRGHGRHARTVGQRPGRHDPGRAGALQPQRRPREQPRRDERRQARGVHPDPAGGRGRRHGAAGQGARDDVRDRRSRTRAGVPDGMTVFPETAVLGDPIPDLDPQTLVGQEVDSFTLHATAEGTVLAADATPAQAIAEDRIQAAVSDGYELVPDSTSIKVGEGTVKDGVIVFPVSATAKQVRPLDAAALEQSVLGLPFDEAEKVLEPYGEVVIVPVARLGDERPVARRSA